MMGFLVRMQFDGLTLFVPIQGSHPTPSLAALVVNAINPNPTSSVHDFKHYPHHPRIRFRERDLFGMYPKNALLPVDGIYTWDLAGDDLSFDVIGSAMDPTGVVLSELLPQYPVSGTRPRNAADRRDYRWYPNLTKIYGAAPSGFMGLVSGPLDTTKLAARMTFPYGTVVSDPSSVSNNEFSFVETVGPHPWVAPHKQCLAGALIAELIITEDTSQQRPPTPCFVIKSARTGIQVELSPQLGGTLDLVLENLSESPGPYYDVNKEYLPEGGWLDVDFELIYLIAAPPPGHWLVPAMRTGHLSSKVHPCAGTFTG